MLAHPNLVRPFRFALVLAAFLIPAAAPASADGPVSAGALPGGATVVSDSDSGNGQRWGRAGGRNITYSINDPSNFSALTFGVVSGTNPSVAFDGAVTSSTTEILSYAAGQSNLAGGMARWIGSAQIVVNGVTQTVPTRFTLTVANASNPLAGIALAFVSGGVNPGASVLATGPFTTNLLFEMQYIGAIGGDNSWRPVLDLYDSLATPAGLPPSTNSGPVMTGVNTGFYFTGAGMTLEDHDANVTGRLISIKDDTAFMRIDVINRLTGLGNTVASISNQTSSMQNQTDLISGIRNQTDQLSGMNGNVNQIMNQVISNSGTLMQIQQTLSNSNNNNNNPPATRSDVQQLQNTFLVLWGLMPCPPEAGPICASAKFIRDLSTQASVDTLAGKVDALQASLASAQSKLDALQDALEVVAPVDVHATQIESKGKALRWIVKVSRDGILVNANLSRLLVIRTAGVAAVAANVLANATVTTIAPGLIDVMLDVVKDVTEGSAYMFEARYTEGSSIFQGSSLVATEKK